MKKYIPLAGFLFAMITLVSTKNLHANIAAGEIIVMNIDDADPCDGNDLVRLVFSYVNECVSSPPPPMQLTLSLNPVANCGSSMSVLAFRDNSKTINGRQFFVENFEVPDDDCVARVRECKLGMQYYVTNAFVLPKCKWDISFTSTMPRATTGLNLVYDGDPTFHVTNYFDNSFPCTYTNTGQDGSPPNKDCIINAENNPAQFIDEVPVLRFCVGKEYHYAFNAIDVDGDHLEYAMLNPQNVAGVNITMIPGFFPDEPFPSATPIDFDPKNGVLSFTPNMDYEATVAFQAREYRDSCWINSEGAWNSKRVLISTSTREVRFVFGSFCSNDSLGMENYFPDPNSPDPTPDSVIVNRLEYDCAVMYLNIKLTEPILCTSIETLGSDFRLVQGDVYDPDTLVAIDSAYSIKPGKIDWDHPIAGGSINPYEPYCDGNQTQNIVIKLNEPLGPGNYKLFLKTGDDYNTLTTKCGLEMDEYTTYNVIVNTKAYNLEFDIEDIYSCRPQNPAPIAIVYPKYGPKSKDAYSWNFKDDTVDATLADELGGVYFDRKELVVDSAGTYSVTFTRAKCTYTDTFDVTIYRDMTLPEIPDYDLCLTDPFPVIDTMRKYLNDLAAQTGKTISNPEWWLYSTKNPEGEIVGFFDTLETILPGRYVFKVTVDLCVLEEEFFITRQTDLDMDIGPDSLILCEGDTAFLKSRIDFEARSPDYLYEWEVDNELQIGETERAFPPVTESGDYIARVYKPSGCFGADTINIEVVDTLTQPDPKCISISYYQGQVFAWAPISAAESYEVNEVYEDRESGWIEAEPDDMITSSHTSTYDVKYLYVRAVNEEVDETYHCKYSPVSTARQCDIVISAPNIFTPNGDGKNDVLMFNLLEIFDGSTLQVYNRWGNLVYESTDYRNDWDGEDIPAGTYFYILNINDDRHAPQKGTFTLVR